MTNKIIKTVVRQGERVTVFEIENDEKGLKIYNDDGTVKHGPIIGQGCFIGWRRNVEDFEYYSSCTVKLDNGRILNWSSDYVVIG